METQRFSHMQLAQALQKCNKYHHSKYITIILHTSYILERTKIIVHIHAEDNRARRMQMSNQEDCKCPLLASNFEKEDTSPLLPAWPMTRTIKRHALIDTKQRNKPNTWQ